MRLFFITLTSLFLQSACNPVAIEKTTPKDLPSSWTSSNTSNPTRQPIKFFWEQTKQPSPALKPEVILPSNLASDTELQTLGLMQDEKGLYPTITLEVPQNVYGLTLLVYSSENSLVYLEDLTGPSNQPLANIHDDLQNFDDIIRITPHKQMKAMAIPNTPDAPLNAGIYTLNMGAFDINDGTLPTLFIALLVRYGEHPQEQGTLDLTLHFTGAENLNAANAKDNPMLTAAIEKLRTIYATAGISIGEIAYEDVSDASLQTVVFTGENCQENTDYQELVRHSKDGDHQGLHLFFIKNFQCINKNMAQTIGGMASDVSGMPLVNGSPNSGVVIALGLLKDADALAYVMAHEMGHFLGLYHSQESNENAASLGANAIYDSILDTANSQDAQNNLMYWSISNYPRLTAGQAWVLRLNPLVH